MDRDAPRADSIRSTRAGGPSAAGGVSWKTSPAGPMARIACPVRRSSDRTSPTTN